MKIYLVLNESAPKSNSFNPSFVEWQLWIYQNILYTNTIITMLINLNTNTG